jgi:hypothetical protein
MHAKGYCQNSTDFKIKSAGTQRKCRKKTWNKNKTTRNGAR